MASELRELYQEIILDHNRRPRNFGALPGANRRAEGHNPLCGDQVAVALDVEGDLIRGVSFEGTGCAISTASASLMTEAVKGKTIAEARDLFAGFHGFVAGGGAKAGGGAPGAEPDLGTLEVFGGVREYPMRVKCATLPWHTLKAALDQADQPVTTE